MVLKHCQSQLVLMMSQKYAVQHSIQADHSTGLKQSDSVPTHTQIMCQIAARY